VGVKRVTVLVFVAAKRKGTTVAQGVLVLHSHAKINQQVSSPPLPLSRTLMNQVVQCPMILEMRAVYMMTRRYCTWKS